MIQVRNHTKALKVMEDWLDYSYFTGNKEFSQAVLHINDILTDLLFKKFSQCISRVLILKLLLVHSAQTDTCNRVYLDTMN